MVSLIVFVLPAVVVVAVEVKIVMTDNDQTQGRAAVPTQLVVGVGLRSCLLGRVTHRGDV